MNTVLLICLIAYPVACVFACFMPSASGASRASHAQRRLEIDEHGVRVVGWGEGNGVTWANLVEVGILTTSDGPYADDVFWVLRASDEHVCVVPSGIAAPLLPRLQALPGFDNETVCVAMGSTSDAKFRVWRGSAGDALSRPYR